MVNQEMVAKTVPCGPDPSVYLKRIEEYVDAGYDEIYVQQIGHEQDAFFRFWVDQVAPALKASVSARG